MAMDFWAIKKQREKFEEDMASLQRIRAFIESEKTSNSGRHINWLLMKCEVEEKLIEGFLSRTTKGEQV